ncbi:hypothetical protein [Cereibacter sphaeroides]|uniref:hypothetical protein n=1 Tax=Cereibacter sphaeroides TaxID=1063 RepID=UPI001F2A5EEE|nr:hypothetical protein [Cereibacter sphaeroides]MCE6968048.1 hypothetical protein [Cereibacter sphaeroides]
MSRQNRIRLIHIDIKGTAMGDMLFRLSNNNPRAVARGTWARAPQRSLIGFIMLGSIIRKNERCLG